MNEKTEQFVVSANFVSYLQEIVKLAKEGWELELDNPTPGLYGFIYEARMYKPAVEKTPDVKVRKAKATEEVKKEE